MKIKKLILLLQFMAALWAASQVENAFAQGNFVNLSINGSLQKSTGTDSVETKTNLGLEISFPFSDYFEISFGRSQSSDITVYGNSTRQYIASKYGVVIPDSIPIENVIEETDTTADVGIGYPLGFITPSIFGGEIWRHTIQQGPLSEPSDENVPATWNAGVALTTMVTKSIRFKVSYRVSPSADPNIKTRDSLTTVGLSWGI